MTNIKYPDSTGMISARELGNVMMNPSPGFKKNFVVYDQSLGPLCLTLFYESSLESSRLLILGIKGYEVLKISKKAPYGCSLFTNSNFSADKEYGIESIIKEGLIKYLCILSEKKARYLYYYSKLNNKALKNIYSFDSDKIDLRKLHIKNTRVFSSENNSKILSHYKNCHNLKSSASYKVNTRFRPHITSFPKNTDTHKDIKDEIDTESILDFIKIDLLSVNINEIFSSLKEVSNPEFSEILKNSDPYLVKRDVVVDLLVVGEDPLNPSSISPLPDYISLFEKMHKQNNLLHFSKSNKSAVEVNKTVNITPASSKIYNTTNNSKSSSINVQTSNSALDQSFSFSIRSRLQRKNLIEELISTEEYYVSKIDFLVKNYMYPLLKSANSKQQNSNHLYLTRVIFGNLEEILKANKTFLKDLKSEYADFKSKFNKSSDSLSIFKIGRICNKNFSNFFLYERYIGGYLRAIKQSQSLAKKSLYYAQFLEKVKAKPGSDKLELRDLLIAPAQRVPRYTLFIKELLKVTQANTSEHSDLLEAFHKINSIGNLEHDPSNSSYLSLMSFYNDSKKKSFSSNSLHNDIPKNSFKGNNYAKSLISHKATSSKKRHIPPLPKLISSNFTIYDSLLESYKNKSINESFNELRTLYSLIDGCPPNLISAKRVLISIVDSSEISLVSGFKKIRPPKALNRINSIFKIPTIDNTQNSDNRKSKLRDYSHSLEKSTTSNLNSVGNHVNVNKTVKSLELNALSQSSSYSQSSVNSEVKSRVSLIIFSDSIMIVKNLNGIEPLTLYDPLNLNKKPLVNDEINLNAESENDSEPVKKRAKLLTWIHISQAQILNNVLDFSSLSFIINKESEKIKALENAKFLKPSSSFTPTRILTKCLSDNSKSSANFAEMELPIDYEKSAIERLKLWKTYRDSLSVHPNSQIPFTFTTEESKNSELDLQAAHTEIFTLNKSISLNNNREFSVKSHTSEDSESIYSNGLNQNSKLGPSSYLSESKRNKSSFLLSTLNEDTSNQGFSHTSVYGKEYWAYSSLHRFKVSNQNDYKKVNAALQLSQILSECHDERLGDKDIFVEKSENGSIFYDYKNKPFRRIVANKNNQNWTFRFWKWDNYIKILNNNQLDLSPDLSMVLDLSSQPSIPSSTSSVESGPQNLYTDISGHNQASSDQIFLPTFSGYLNIPKSEIYNEPTNCEIKFKIAKNVDSISSSKYVSMCKKSHFSKSDSDCIDNYLEWRPISLKDFNAKIKKIEFKTKSPSELSSIIEKTLDRYIIDKKNHPISYIKSSSFCISYLLDIFQGLESLFKSTPNSNIFSYADINNFENGTKIKDSELIHSSISRKNLETLKETESVPHKLESNSTKNNYSNYSHSLGCTSISINSPVDSLRPDNKSSSESIAHESSLETSSSMQNSLSGKNLNSDVDIDEILDLVFSIKSDIRSEQKFDKNIIKNTPTKKKIEPAVDNNSIVLKIIESFIDKIKLNGALSNFSIPIFILEGESTFNDFLNSDYVNSSISNSNKKFLKIFDKRIFCKADKTLLKLNSKPALSIGIREFLNENDSADSDVDLNITSIYSLLLMSQNFISSRKFSNYNTKDAIEKVINEYNHMVTSKTTAISKGSKLVKKNSLRYLDNFKYIKFNSASNKTKISTNPADTTEPELTVSDTFIPVITKNEITKASSNSICGHETINKSSNFSLESVPFFINSNHMVKNSSTVDRNINKPSDIYISAQSGCIPDLDDEPRKSGESLVSVFQFLLSDGLKESSELEVAGPSNKSFESIVSIKPKKGFSESTNDTKVQEDIMTFLNSSKNEFQTIEKNQSSSIKLSKVPFEHNFNNTKKKSLKSLLKPHNITSQDEADYIFV
ncbi:Rho guanine nucleotide exchange factor 17 [Smittium culicis]|uniref:Rho guanine nucleotide exchange factor 17 n=1 Tax=Smittium culicis TaxID=133412 RepID=A0A1R1YH35_9FUNG|nr:Rho guanine nucleotide exchange factor 17 [Smittium culicis]